MDHESRLAHVVGFIVLIGLLACFFSGQNVWARGKVVVNNDEWTLSNTGFSRLPDDTRRFVVNLARFFTGEMGSFHAFSTNFSYTQTSLRTTLEEAGYTYSTGTDISFDLPTLLGFDAIFLGGDLLNEEQISTLIDYVQAGGSVYLAAGTSFSNPAAVAATWNPFLETFGMSIASANNGIRGNINVTGSSHPIFNGVIFLYQDNGQTISGDGIEVSLNDQGLYSTFGLAIATNSLSAVKLGEPFSQELRAVSGTPPYSWFITNGMLPAGVDLSPDGLLGGTPMEAGEFDVAVRVTDSSGDLSEKEFTLKVLVTLPHPDIRLRKMGTTPVPGRVLDQFIIVENISDIQADNLEVVDFLDPSFDLLSLTPPAQTDASVLRDSTIVLWNLEPVAAGDTVILSHQVRIDPTTPIGKDVGKPVCTAAELVGISTCIDLMGPPLGCDIFCGQACASIIQTCLVTPNPIGCAFTIGACLSCTLICNRDFASGIGKCFRQFNCDIPETVTTGPIDPNEKVVVAKRFIQPDQKLVYSIHFENIGSVEALDVFVTDMLDPNLDTSTLDIRTPEGASFDESSRTLKWDLIGRNLQPGETDNVLLSIRPLPGLPSGTEIRNSAEIQFEIFDPLITPEVVNIIDSTPPSCVMAPLPAESTSPFSISWNGTDEIGEIDNYSILVSADGGGLTPLIERTRELGATFTGESGKVYEFICIATDTAGNTEVQEPVAETTTFVQHTLRFAQLGDGEQLVSQIILFNLDETTAATGQITLNDDTGLPLSVRLNGETVEGQLDFTIPPSGLRVFRTGGDGQLKAGAVTVASNVRIAGVILLEGSAGVAGVGNSLELANRFVAPMEVNSEARINTGIAVMNLETDEATLSLELVGSEGDRMSTSQIKLAANGHAARFVNEFDWEPNVDFSDFQGLLKITPSGTISATVIQTRPSEFVTMPVAEAELQLQPASSQEDGASSKLYFAQFAELSGRLFSQIVLFSLDESQEANAQLILKDDNGQPLSVSLNGVPVEGELDLSIPAGGLRILKTTGDGALKTGSVAVSSDAPLAGVIIFAGTVGAAGVGSSPELARGFVAPMEVNSEFQVNTGIAVMSLDDKPVTLDLALVDSDGVTLANARLVLQGMGHLAHFVDEFEWDSAVDFTDFRGLLKVIPSGAISGTVIQARPGQFATMPVAGTIE